MALKLISTEVVPVTKKLAKQVRDMAALPSERALKASRAMEHARLIAQEQFFSPLWGSCKFEGVEYRGNGNHTSNVILACMQAHNGGLDEKAKAFFENCLTSRNSAFKKPEDLPEVKEGEIEAVYETYEAEEQGDLVVFFQRFDSAKSARSNIDVLGVYISEQDDLKELNRDRVRHALTGVLLAAKADPSAFGLPESQDWSKFRSTEIGKALRIQQIRNVVQWIVESVSDASIYKHPIGARVCAEVYGTYGEAQGERIIATMIDQIESDTDPAAAFDAALNKRLNKSSPESLLKKGRQAVKEIAKGLPV